MKEKDTNIGSILKMLMFNKGINASHLSRETGVPQQTIQRLTSGSATRPYLSTLIPIADYFSITIEQLKGIESIKDLQHSIQTKSKIPLSKIPLVKSENLNNWFSDKANNTNVEYIYGDFALSDNAFAVVMYDSSMEPSFPAGTILIIDCDNNYLDRQFVIVQMHSEKKWVFRQLLINAGLKYLKAISPELSETSILKLDKNDCIYGSLIEARKTYRK